ncbi:basic salivary proline-rich protein 2-like [Pantherophis guttatus]|uniref:Basic salivary proline-rich protein 2-like n=1 Tax=Pantherophis guttatus TaxID=94885 RepID=A0ABM3YQL6_PANGU|nr:basic salivary proline-rich protein 2-like [Pantherophis guttatus]
MGGAGRDRSPRPGKGGPWAAPGPPRPSPSRDRSQPRAHPAWRAAGDGSCSPAPAEAVILRPAGALEVMASETQGMALGAPGRGGRSPLVRPGLGPQAGPPRRSSQATGSDAPGASPEGSMPAPAPPARKRGPPLLTWPSGRGSGEGAGKRLREAAGRATRPLLAAEQGGHGVTSCTRDAASGGDGLPPTQRACAARAARGQRGVGGAEPLQGK